MEKKAFILDTHIRKEECLLLYVISALDSRHKPMTTLFNALPKWTRWRSLTPIELCKWLTKMKSSCIGRFGTCEVPVSQQKNTSGFVRCQGMPHLSLLGKSNCNLQGCWQKEVDVHSGQWQVFESVLLVARWHIFSRGRYCLSLTLYLSKHVCKHLLRPQQASAHLQAPLGSTPETSGLLNKLTAPAVYTALTCMKPHAMAVSRWPAPADHAFPCRPHKTLS